MPDMFAHYLVAEAAAQRADAGRLLADAFDAYKVGAQGPDVFFYSRLVRGRRGRPNLAHLTHQHQMAAAFRSMLARAAASPAGERGAAFAFVAGYAAHLCLDAEAHPWVLYWTGDITDGADPLAKTEAFRRHGILEASIDVILTRERSDDTAWLRRQRLLRLPSAQAMTAATLLSGMLNDVYGVTFTPAEGRSAFRAMEWVYTTMSDPRALPTRLLGMVAPAVDKGGVVRTQIYPETPAPAAAAPLRGAEPPGTTPRCRTNRAPRRSRRSSRPRRPRRRAASRRSPPWPIATRPWTRRWPSSATEACSPVWPATTRARGSPSRPTAISSGRTPGPA